MKRARLLKRVAALAMFGIAGCMAAFALVRTADPVAGDVSGGGVTGSRAASAPASAAGGTHKPGARRVYPYSIVPGGVAGPAELASVIRTDKVVAAHYATFDVDQARAVTVATPRAVHVSYRKGDKVYWTANKVMLAAGETLLSDGTHEMRARCANRISDVPQFPVDAQEPDAGVLDSAVDEQAYAEGDDTGAAFALVSEGGIPRHTGGAIQRLPTTAGTDAGAGASAGTSTGTSTGAAASTAPGLDALTLSQFGWSSSMRTTLPAAEAGPVTSRPTAPTLVLAPAAPVGIDPAGPAGTSGPDGAPAVPSDHPAAGTGAGSTPPASGLPPLPGTPPASSTPPASGTPPASAPQVPASGGADIQPPGSRPAPGSGVGSGGSGGGGGSGAPPLPPAPGDSGPGPFIPEPGAAPPVPPTAGSEVKPAPVPMPEPATGWLAGAALAAMALLRRRPRP